MTARMVTYKVKDGRADENTAYVREVMADLGARSTGARGGRRRDGRQA